MIATGKTERPSPSVVFDITRKHYTLNVRSRGKQFCFPESPDVRLGKHQDSRENKTNWFPEEPDIKCFVIFLDFHFNSNKRITEANQNSRLGTY